MCICQRHNGLKTLGNCNEITKIIALADEKVADEKVADELEEFGFEEFYSGGPEQEKTPYEIKCERFFGILRTTFVKLSSTHKWTYGDKEIDRVKRDLLIANTLIAILTS